MRDLIGDSEETGYVSEATAQHYPHPGSTTDPQHLYGTFIL